MFERIPLKELCTVNQGLQIPISKREKMPGDNRYFYITVQFLKNNSENYYIENPPSATTCTKDDILMVRTGNTGQVITGVEGCFHNNFFKVTPNSKVCSKYLYYVLKSEEMYKRILNAASGTTIPDLKHSSFYALDIPVPDMEVQVKIANILSAIDKKIETNTHINRNLSEQARTVYNENFGSLEKTKVLEDYPVKIYSGGTPNTSKKEYWEDGNIHWLSSGETANEFVISTEKTITQLGVDNSSTKWASKYDVVTASAGQGHTRGQTTMLLLDTCVNQSVIVTHAEKDYMPFIFFNVSGRYEELRALSDGTSTRGSLTTKIMAKLEMTDASEEEIKAFSEYAWPIISQIEVNLKENERLTSLRDSLLPKLMSGELDVSNIEV